MARINIPSFPAAINIIIGHQLAGHTGFFENQVLTLYRIRINSKYFFYSENGTDVSDITENRIRLFGSTNDRPGQGTGELELSAIFYNTFQPIVRIKKFYGSAFPNSYYTFLDIAKTVGGLKYQGFGPPTHFQTNYFSGTVLFGDLTGGFIKAMWDATTPPIPPLPPLDPIPASAVYDITIGGQRVFE